MLKHCKSPEANNAPDNCNLEKFLAVRITKEQYNGWDEIYTQFFVCPYCIDDTIIRDFNYCPNCGIKLIWDVVGELD